MFLITSSALIESELRSEFGPIPPAFLPVGNKRLFEHQLDSLPKDKPVTLTIPEDYQLEPFDLNRLRKEGVNILRLPLGLSLGEAILYSINLLTLPEGESLDILHGDTLFSQLPDGNDVIALSEVGDSYNWASYIGSESQLLGTMEPCEDGIRSWVASGYFSFSQPKELSRVLIESHFLFIDAVNLYHQRLGLKPIKTNKWLDFGHVHTYYRSKSHMTTQRAFNDMDISPRLVTKMSQKFDKMRAEANWFTLLPKSLKSYTPQLIALMENESKVGYQLEYLYLTALNELFTFGELPPFVWRKILSSCLEFVDSCLDYPAPKDTCSADLDSLFGEKTKQRLNEFSLQSRIELNQNWSFNGKTIGTLNEILADVDSYLPAFNKLSTWYHGDLCFSNILYDFRTESIKVIDPRGVTPEGEISPYGDVRYDLAKLSHSIIGLYDLIIAGYYELDWGPYDVKLKLASSNRRAAIEEYFVSIIERRYGLSEANLLAMQIHLFLSMLPLHFDNKNRQKAMLANAFRLYTRLGALK